MTLRLIGLAFLGGALGSLARYALSLSFEQSVWLWVANILGALLLGLVHTHQKLKSPSFQNLLGTGFAGGFTTLSSLITFASLEGDSALLQMIAQIGVGLFAYALGRNLGGERTW
jgi:fluoride ion exporter CrcB/FEX